MKVLAISDVEEAWLTTYYDRDRMADVELIISCGDLPATYLEHIVTLANVPLLYVPGNHDRDYDNHPPQGCIPIDNRTIECQGLRIMGFGGSVRYNDRIVGYSEQEMYWKVFKQSLLARLSGEIDLLVTHAPIRGYGDLDDLPHQGFEAFNTCLEIVHPTIMVHGHVHMNYGRIERERNHPSGTRIINACGAQIFEIEPKR